MIQMNVRIDDKDLKLINKISTKQGIGNSDFVRMVIRKEFARLGYLRKDESKALGV